MKKNIEYAACLQCEWLGPISKCKRTVADVFLCPKCGCEAEPIGKAEVNKDPMEWTTDQPTEAGYYWFLDRMFKEDVPRVVEVRSYAGKMAIGNWRFGDDAERYPARYLWSGPWPNHKPVPVRYFKMTRTENGVSQSQYFVGENTFADMFAVIRGMFVLYGIDAKTYKRQDDDINKMWWAAMHSGGAQKFEYNFDPVTSIMVQEIRAEDMP